MKRWFALFVVSLLLAPATAQVDDQMDDIEEQDRRYLERMKGAEKTRETQEDRSALADRLIRDLNHDKLVTDHYVIQTDDPRVDLEEAGRLLEESRTFFASVLTPPAEPGRVYLFWSKFRFNEVRAGAPMRLAGASWPKVDMAIVHTDGVSPGDLPDVIVREAARLAVGEAPPWVVEGIGSYFGHAYRSSKTGFEPGVVGGKNVRLIREAKGAKSRSAGSRLRDLEKALREEPGAVLAAAVESSSRSDHAAAAWMLVHFLLHSRDGARADVLRRYLADEGSLDELLGVSLSSLGDEFAAHVKNVRVR